MLGSVVSEVLSVGQRFAEREEVADTAILLAHGTASTLVVDIEVLFTPETGVSVVPLLHQMAKQGPLIVAWPGYIGAGRFRYSQMGRSDYVDAPVDGALILHPVETHFPDECPFAIERNSA